MYRLFTLGLFGIFLSTLTYAQDLKKIDSLYQLANLRTVDTAKVRLYEQIVYEYTISTKYLAKAKLITDTLCQMAAQLQDVNSLVACLDTRGSNLRHESKNAEAIVLYEQALQKIREINNKYREAYILNNIGLAYARLDDYQKSIDYHLQAQKIAETTNNLRNLANATVSIGNCYRRMKRYELALTYFHRGLALEKTQNVKLGISINMNNIGIIHSHFKNYDSALYYIQKSLELSQVIQNHKGIAISYGHLGSIYLAKKDMSKALTYYLKALDLDEELGDKRYISESNLLVGNLYNELGNYKLAIKHLERALEVAKIIRSKSKIQSAYETLAKVHANMKVYDKAFMYSEQAILYKDSVLNEENQRNIAQQEARFQNESKEAQIKLLQKDQLHNEAIIKQQKNIFLAMGMAIVLFIVLVFVLIYNNRQKHFINQLLREQKTEIEQQRNNIVEQHKVLEVKNQEIAKKNIDITASINYAQRIQAAILPTAESISQIFEEFFIFYQPRDIVSGDFYWAYQAKRNSKLYSIMVVADCVGHGVPGAFMSMIGNNILNNIIKENRIVEPERILSLVDVEIVKTLQQKQSKSKDSIDMVVLCIDQNERMVEFAGAMNPLHYVQNGELHTIKGDSLNIGGYLHADEDEKLFTKHTIQLPTIGEKTVFYLTSDGYQDQFGGEKNKKFMVKRLKEMFVNIHTQSMEAQKNILQTTLNKWIIDGNEQQTDDVTIVGIKL